MTGKEINAMEMGDRVYSNTCGHRFWYYTGIKTVVKSGTYYSLYHKVGETIYMFEDACGHTDEFSADQLKRSFEAR